jgi:hypothetical protein
VPKRRRSPPLPPKSLEPKAIRARPVHLSKVRVTGGPAKAAQDATAKYLLSLDPDRMMAYYRQRAGLQQKAQPYAGWDGGGRNLTGHIAGHHLSAVSYMYLVGKFAPNASATGFYDAQYAIPPELTKGKARVTVKFAGVGPGRVAPVFGVRMIKPF